MFYALFHKPTIYRSLIKLQSCMYADETNNASLSVYRGNETHHGRSEKKKKSSVSLLQKKLVREVRQDVSLHLVR